MAKLIDRQEAIDQINRAIPDWSEDKETAIDCLSNLPAVDAIPVFVIEQIIKMSKAHYDSLVQLAVYPLVTLLKTWKEITEDKNNE